MAGGYKLSGSIFQKFKVGILRNTPFLKNAILCTVAFEVLHPFSGVNVIGLINLVGTSSLGLINLVGTSSLQSSNAITQLLQSSEEPSETS